MSENSEQVAPHCLFILFGASTDLAQRMLLPSLFNLATRRLLPDQFMLLGFASKDWDDNRFRDHIEESLNKFWGEEPSRDTLRWLQERSSWQSGDFTTPASFEALSTTVKRLEKDGVTGGNRIFYLAVAADLIASISRQLSQTGLGTEEGDYWRRLIVEKPFGNDLPSAIALDAELWKDLEEKQIYRIDHFAGKDAVLDIPVFRFSNPLFEAVWNRAQIDNVQITAAETVGLEDRASFYEETGALRDMVPNHLARVLSMIAMEPPNSFSAQHLGAKQAEVLEGIRPVQPGATGEWAVRGQYGAATTKGKPVPAYRAEHNVAPDSKVETYVALRVMIDNWRWAEVPFYLRTGKRLAKALTEVVVTFRKPPASLFAGLPWHNTGIVNRVIFRLQPDPGIFVSFGSKAPGLTPAADPSMFRFCMPPGEFGEHGKGYERLLYDCMRGDQKLFGRADMVEAGWRMVQPFLDAWKNPADSPDIYAAGSSGPHAADDLLAARGHTWYSLETE